jgi:hypothetical protein
MTNQNFLFLALTISGGHSNCKVNPFFDLTIIEKQPMMPWEAFDKRHKDSWFTLSWRPFW